MQDKLNQKLFDSDDKLKPEISNRLIDIVNEFLDQIDDGLEFDIIDVRLVGSNASYNYTEYSDLDVHIVVNLADICREHPEIVQYLFNSEKSRFNLNYDISIKGIDVEIYVEDVRAGTMSNGIYSILDNDWVKFPQKSDIKDTNIDSELLDEYVEMVEKALDSGDSREVVSAINNLYLLRKNSLESEGEYGRGNLVFKEIRNMGLLDELKQAYYDDRSDELSIEAATMLYL